MLRKFGELFALCTSRTLSPTVSASAHRPSTDGRRSTPWHCPNDKYLSVEMVLENNESVTEVRDGGSPAADLAVTQRAAAIGDTTFTQHCRPDPCEGGGNEARWLPWSHYY